MKVIEIQNSFGLENLTIQEKPTPVPQSDEILVKMKAVSLNYRDLLMVKGHYNPKQALPLVPCSDGSGEIVAVGEKIENFQVGDFVATTFFQAWSSGKARPEKMKTTLGGPLDGTLAEYMIMKEEGVVRAPKHLSFVEIATLPCAALTAWTALVTEGQVKAGDTVLIQGTGGVALFALQLAKILGARVIITSSSDEKLEKAKDLGADETINYQKNSNWGKEVLRLTHNHGVDLIIELGGAKTLPQTFKACRPGGKIALIGVLSGVVNDLNILPIIMNNLSITGIFVGKREDFEEMNRAISLHQLKPVIDRIFSWENVKDALEYMDSGKHFGKICLSF